jgi:2-polyprenyl-3-methyl-5-hydroxy-6-metoxy-1,4-benzoquinol methylase
VGGELGHWRRVYRDRRPEEVSWHEPAPEVSLALIEEAGLAPGAAILDAGGGASRLAGRLLGAGYTDITVADASGAALERAREELGEAAGRIEWVVADLRDHDFGRRYDLWHAPRSPRSTAPRFTDPPRAGRRARRPAP